MVVNKGNWRGLCLHGAVVLLTLVVATGSLAPALLWLTALHMATDALKAQVRPGLAAFLADQGAHVVAVGALALWQPGLFSSGLWASHPALPGLMTLAAGAVLATRAGGFAIGF